MSTKKPSIGAVILEKAPVILSNYCQILTLSTHVSSADINTQNLPTLKKKKKKKKMKFKIFSAIFGFGMKNAFKWVQTSLVSVMWLKGYNSYHFEKIF